MRYNTGFQLRSQPVHITVAAGLLLALSACFAQAQQYRMKEDEPRIGTTIKRDMARLNLPFDKTWGELSDSDKARVRGLYVNMAEDDEPPFPAKGFGSLMRSMATVQRQLQIEGMVDMGVIVGADGRATEIKVYKSPDPQLTRVIANVLVLEKYKPALCHGLPCSQEFPFRTSFIMTH
jgi:hypothetical protein